MNECEKIGTWGGVGLILTLCLTKVLISAPSLYAKQSASAGWLEVIISGIFEMLVLLIVLKLLFRFENMDIIDVSDSVFGNAGRIIVGSISTIVFVVGTAAVFRCFGELIRNTVIRGISYENVAFFLLVVGITGAYLGFRTQVSLNSLVLPFVLVGICVVLLINVPRYSIVNILPIFGTGVGHVVKNALLKNASFYEFGILLFLFPYLREKTAVKKIGFTGLIFSVFVTSAITLLYQLSVPYEAAGTFALPLYQMTRMIKAGTFFQRIEPLNVFIWGGVIFLYVGIGIRMSAHIYKKTFKLNDTKPLVFIFALIICLLALIPGSETSVERIYDFLMTYSYIAYPLMPLGLLIVATALQKREGGTS